jgi:hypothetical protein
VHTAHYAVLNHEVIKMRIKINLLIRHHILKSWLTAIIRILTKYKTEETALFWSTIEYENAVILEKFACPDLKSVYQN